MKFKTCPPKGRLITLHSCSSVDCCSLDFGKEGELWDLAASLEGGGAALGRYSPSSSATSKLCPQTPAVKTFLSSCQLLRKGLLLLCTAGRGKNLGQLHKMHVNRVICTVVL